MDVQTLRFERCAVEELKAALQQTGWARSYPQLETASALLKALKEDFPDAEPKMPNGLSEKEIREFAVSVLTWRHKKVSFNIKPTELDVARICAKTLLDAGWFGIRPGVLNLLEQLALSKSSLDANSLRSSG